MNDDYPISVEIDDPLEPDDPYNDLLPAGWLIDGSPAFMSDLWNFPLLMKPSVQLTFNQKKALVKARILKRNNYYLNLTISVFSQESAIKELNTKSLLSQIIIDDEIDLLDNVRSQRIKVLGL